VNDGPLFFDQTNSFIFVSLFQSNCRQFFFSSKLTNTTHRP